MRKLRPVALRPATLVVATLLVCPASLTLADQIVELPATTTTEVTLPTPIDSKAWFALVDKGIPTDIAAAINLGIDVNMRDAENRTALMIAAMNGRSDLVQLLIDGGADVNAQDNAGRTALHWILATKPEAPKKKKSGLGGFLGSALSGALTNALGGNLLNAAGLSQLSHIPGANLMRGLSGDLLSGLLTDSLGATLSNQYLPSLLTGGGFDLNNGVGWMGVIGSALQGDAKVASLFNKNIGAGEWVSLLSAANKSNPQVLAALGNAAIPEAQKAQWGQFLQLATTGDKKAVAKLMQDDAMRSLLEGAEGGLGQAIAALPGRDGGTGIAALLIQNGADLKLLNNEGQNALQRAMGLKMEALAELLAKAVSTPATPVQ